MSPRRNRAHSENETPRTSRRSTRKSTPPALDTEGLALLVAGQEHFATYSLPQSGAVMIGRAEDNTICIEDPTLSRHHAVLHIGDKLAVEDSGSANGTLVRNQRLPASERTSIEVNEAIIIGSVTIIVQRRKVAVERRMLRTNDYFEERLYDECARAERYGTLFSIAHMRLDRPLPDQTVQACISRLLRPSDIVGTYGPQEYDLLLLELDATVAAKVMDRIDAAFGQRGVKARFAIATYGADGRTPAELAGVARTQLRERATGPGEPEPYIVREPAMTKIHDLARRIAATEIVVLLLGETGVGKEVLAEVIHTGSPRANGPFLRLNCSALSQSLLESELFGHERGAFTGASETKKGLLEVAAGGTVFLDEVGEMPLDTQVKLLRVLEERTLMRVGGTKPLKVDVRFVAATHRNLESAIQLGRFREDLFYRLNAFSILIPPLRERPRDIEPLALRFIRRVCEQLGRPEPELSPRAVALLCGYAWPGNVRELRNVIERAAVLARGNTVTAEHLPDKLRFGTGDGPIPERTEPVITLPPPIGSPTEFTGLKRRLGPDEERQVIVSALDKCGGNQTDAAALLGVSRRTLLNKLDRFNIARPRKKSRV